MALRRTRVPRVCVCVSSWRNSEGTPPWKKAHIYNSVERRKKRASRESQHDVVARYVGSIYVLSQRRRRRRRRVKRRRSCLSPRTYIYNGKSQLSHDLISFNWLLRLSITCKRYVYMGIGNYCFMETFSAAIIFPVFFFIIVLSVLGRFRPYKCGVFWGPIFGGAICRLFSRWLLAFFLSNRRYMGFMEIRAIGLMPIGCPISDVRFEAVFFVWLEMCAVFRYILMQSLYLNRCGYYIPTSIYTIVIFCNAFPVVECSISRWTLFVLQLPCIGIIDLIAY